MFERTIIEAAKTHARLDYPKEAVGIVVGGEYLPQANVSRRPEAEFALPRDFFVPAGALRGVLHSHPDGVDYPSAPDMAGQIATGVPWGIIVCDAERAADPVWCGDYALDLPLTGPERYFRHGVTDCYALIRAYYRQIYGISLPDFARAWEWWQQRKEGGAEPQNLYGEGFSAAGFRQIPESEVKPGDVFLAAIRSPVPCHGGIYLGGSGDMILHHLCSGRPVDRTRLAAEEPGARYIKYVTHWLRHKESPGGLQPAGGALRASIATMNTASIPGRELRQ